jgi:hypothetical protein
MEPSLHSLPSDVLRVIVNHVLSRPFTLGVLGRVCRDLYAKTNTLEDLWHRLATMTPDAGSANAESSAGESKVAASRSKLNRFAALVKRIKLGQCNVTAISEASGPYVAEAKRIEEWKKGLREWRETLDPSDEPDEEEEEAEFDDNYDDYDYDDTTSSFNVMRNVGSTKFNLIVKDEEHGSSWMHSYIGSVSEYDIKNPIATQTSIPTSLFSVEVFDSARLIGDRFILIDESDLEGTMTLKCVDKASMSEVTFDLSGATSSPFPTVRIIRNRDAKFPWIMLHCVGAVEGRKGNGRMMRGRGGRMGSASSFQEERSSFAIYDLAQGKFILKDKPLKFEADHAEFFDTRIVITEPRDDNSTVSNTTCYEVDIEAGDIITAWKSPHDIRVLYSSGDLGWAFIDDFYYMISLKDGSVIVDYDLDLRRSATGITMVTKRFFLRDSYLYDVFNPTERIFYTAWQDVDFVSESHWLVTERSSVYVFDFEAPHEGVDGPLPCCTLGEIKIWEPQKGALISVDCVASRAELPVDHLLESIAKIIGCAEADLFCTRYKHYSNEYVPVVCSNECSPAVCLTIFSIQVICVYEA